jgi:hypothetical protein
VTKVVPRPQESPTYCINNAGSFIGISGQSDVALDESSSVSSGVSNEACEAASGIVAGIDNKLGGPSQYLRLAFIGAGASNISGAPETFIGAGFANTVASDHSFVGAGIGNAAGALGSFIGAGGTAQFEATGFTQPSNQAYYDSFIGAGDINSKSSGYYAGFLSFNGAGQDNTINNPWSSIVGGYANTAASTAYSSPGNPFSAILGGASNVSLGEYSAVTGGDANTAGAEYSEAVGGADNSASDVYAVTLGGNRNLAQSSLTLAGGYNAATPYRGSFVWSDDVPGSATLADTAANQFVARASGGVTLYTDQTKTGGVTLASGAGTWASLSDRNAKNEIAPIDGGAVLAKLSTIPVDAWSYKFESGVRHMGPMAQDFYSAFRLGVDDRHITSIDEGGVAIAALKGLYAHARTKEKQIAHQRYQIDQLRRQMRHIESELRLAPQQ